MSFRNFGNPSPTNANYISNFGPQQVPLSENEVSRIVGIPVKGGEKIKGIKSLYIRWESNYVYALWEKNNIIRVEAVCGESPCQEKGHRIRITKGFLRSPKRSGDDRLLRSWEYQAVLQRNSSWKESRNGACGTESQKSLVCAGGKVMITIL